MPRLRPRRWWTRCLPSIPRQAPTGARPYALLSADKTAVTFYYDKQAAERKAENPDAIVVYKLSSTSTSDKAPWATASLATATFDGSFVEYEGLTNLDYWFHECRALATINGITNLKTANVTSMRYMFQNCGALTEIDLSGKDTAGAYDRRAADVTGEGQVTIADVKQLVSTVLGK